MSRFYVQLKGGASVGSATVSRRAHKAKGAYVLAASYKGAVRVTPYVNENGVDCVRVTREPWENSGGNTVVLFDLSFGGPA